MIPSLVRFILFAMVSRAVYGCTCMQEHHQEQFCKSDYVIKGKVIKVDVPPSVGPGLLQGPIVHTVKVNTVFKDETWSIEEGTVIKVISTRSPAQCGSILDLGDYLIGGQGDGSGLHTGLCEITKKWKHVPDCQRKSLMGNYYDCRCGITRCAKNERCSYSYNSCTMKSTREASTEDNAYCVKSMMGRRCSWRRCPSEHNIFRSIFGFHL